MIKIILQKDRVAPLMIPGSKETICYRLLLDGEPYGTIYLSNSNIPPTQIRNKVWFEECSINLHNATVVEGPHINCLKEDDN